MALLYLGFVGWAADQAGKERIRVKELEKAFEKQTWFIEENQRVISNTLKIDLLGYDAQIQWR